MQKRLVLILDGLQNRGSETIQAVERVSRRLTKLHEAQIRIAAEVGSISQKVGALGHDLHLFRAEVSGRFEAVGARFDEVENALDSLRTDIKDARTEIVSQNLETLNAVQEATNGRVQVNELSDAVNEFRSQLR